MNYQNLRNYGWLFLFIFSCSSQKGLNDDLFGTWIVSSKFYKATCEILKEDGQVKGKILFYDNGTLRHYHSKNKPYYFFQNLIEKDQIYVDAVSGATQTKLDNTNLTIEVIHKDTLKVTTFIQKQPIQEFWIRNL